MTLPGVLPHKRSMANTKCPELYEGVSYPEFHGTQCMLDEKHVGRHYAYLEDPASKGRLIPLSWYTALQKAEVRERLKGGLGNE